MGVGCFGHRTDISQCIIDIGFFIQKNPQPKAWLQGKGFRPIKILDVLEITDAPSQVSHLFVSDLHAHLGVDAHHRSADHGVSPPIEGHVQVHHRLSREMLLHFERLGDFSLLEHKKKLRRLYFVLFGVAMVWGLYNSLFIQPIQTHFQYYSLLPMGLLILGLSVRFFYSVIRLEKYSQADLLSIPHLWIVAFITFFYVEALTLFGFMEFYASANLDIIIAWTKLNRIIAGVMYLSFGLAFYTPNIFEKKLA